jgi:hypothetical protein
VIIIDHGKYTAEFSDVNKAQEYIDARYAEDISCTVKIRVKIPGSEFEPLAEAIRACGGSIL